MEETVRQHGDVVMRHFFSRQALDDYGDLNVEIVPPACTTPETAMFFATARLQSAREGDIISPT